MDQESISLIRNRESLVFILQQFDDITVKMKTRREIDELWKTHHACYQYEKKMGNREAELTHAEICRVLEWVLS